MSMQTLHLDFLHPSPPRFKAGLWLLVFGLLLTLTLGWRFQQLRSEQDQLQSQLDNAQRLQHRDLPRRAAGSDEPANAAAIAYAITVIAALNLRWDAMFADLEAAANNNIALLAIQPEAGATHIRIAGQARRFDDLLAYISRLEATRGFSNVLMLNHKSAEAPEQALSFTLIADWNAQ